VFIFSDQLFFFAKIFKMDKSIQPLTTNGRKKFT